MLCTTAPLGSVRGRTSIDPGEKKDSKPTGWIWKLTDTKGLGKYDIPLMVLARLAVDHREQGQGLGKALLKDAILRTLQAAEIAVLKLLLVHAKDEAAADFYRKHGFEPVVDDPLKLFLPVPLSSG